ncbi:helicase SKI2W-like [Teleopsis dalmanni]|uniref:helicase SKI2W-like n=1 Tax=Teleopsis dalmanni TaxID=139649 RepID=UPI0018CEE3D6|nr:helicase SKI2W-like [Teleopsis dalmanni]
MDLIDEKNKKKLNDYILYPENPIFNQVPDIIERTYDEMRLLHMPKAPASTKLVPRRDFMTGKIIKFEEVDLEDVGANACNSTSMRREPGLLEETTHGSSKNYPFLPGGFDELPRIKLTADNFDFGTELLTVPPGFSKGHDFANKSEFNSHSFIKIQNEHKDNINLLDDLEKDLDVQEWLKLSNQVTGSEKSNATGNQLLEYKDVDEDILKEDVRPVIEISKSNTKLVQAQWAEMVDITQPVTDFKEKVPCPAMTYPFELDVFQKQAIIKLEERKYVFVAAHTSAGKTVVAEYAIALSKRDLTRTVYTSPIKALSNQKYRDFKKMFDDVGLITGDLQINPTANCLIMTTEILRSMLYCGSEVTRDLEYVIFDEVHYINNPERGHVWEEVIILLPDHVNIIMLSATVPNTMELANWVGSTKKRKVYVISTLKRPVPLLHYLYIGSNGKSKDDHFLLVDDKGTFMDDNYKLAVQKKDEMQAKWKTVSKGKPGPKMGLNPKQETRIWIGIIEFLKRHNKMPVVAFTLSRNRCDQNAQNLTSVDLNTASEKGAVHKFFQQCLTKLKPPDRKLPQVLIMKDSLERGIGVHHSGILPILKEIVEMLFQNGLVKLLFATETFAMGVNMPARTVLFDSHRKFDGIEQRNLKPAEYIQMAGRAGRRGHDENGTVMMICKQAIPPAMEMRAMILGQPEKLCSQFILRYAVILTCLRIESIKVEDIMQYSFKEFYQKQQIPNHQKQLQAAQDTIEKMPPMGEHLKPLCEFFDAANSYIAEKKAAITYIFEKNHKLHKELKIGRVIIITSGKHFNKLGIILQISKGLSKEPNFRVLVLDHQFKNTTPEEYKDELFYKMVSLTPQNKFFHPEGIGGHAVVDIKPNDIVDITRQFVKIDADVVLRDWDQRQIERFKDTSPGTWVTKIVSELHQLNEQYNANPNSMKIFNISKEVNLFTDQEFEKRDSKDVVKDLNSVLPHTNIAGFEEEFGVVFGRKLLLRKIEELKFKNSTKNLSLYPDYCNKMKVLRALEYVDSCDEVTLKGKVACEMGQNELLITEIILCNIFNELEPYEIAALLSGLVFQAKVKEEPEIPLRLRKCVEEIYRINERIVQEELLHHISESEERLNFGLIHVVYEWARNKPFAEIMTLTDIQEGIIVRVIQQLDELLRDVKTASIRIGNPVLQHKMEAASNAIKRDIVFTASLYTEF